MENPYIQDQVDEGAAAYKAGHPNGMNPYRGDSGNAMLRRKRFASWRYGWRCAMAEAEVRAVQQLSAPMLGGH